MYYYELKWGWYHMLKCYKKIYQSFKVQAMLQYINNIVEDNYIKEDIKNISNKMDKLKTVKWDFSKMLIFN